MPLYHGKRNPYRPSKKNQDTKETRTDALRFYHRGQLLLSYAHTEEAIKGRVRDRQDWGCI